ncbi:conserved hypothetical protein [Bradyrhizobium sp. ORS 375]|uniref:peptidoglycan-binding domain-containing protein n=1 Tax=Bradyrhizobium sp. (strain ORS 375) TaxID=566679 RepID=UPI0002406F2C|nr:peptidoglycan-binding domain-containing protein [Bradyrhizobium sp. ORS 375]CCD94724.1 conserved hypothetical protein [Bradyrhizobium sp. ORS 375]
MPRRAAEDDEAPPRRRKRAAAAAVVEAADERGWLMRAMLYSPKDLFAGLLACAAASAIIVNAVFLQSGPHPAPMFGSIVTIPPVLTSSNPLPRPRPAEAISPFDPKAIETRPPESRATEPKVAEPRVAETRSDQKYADPLADLVRSVSGGQAATPRPQPTQQGANARRVAAVQRALTEYGYGQLKATGMVGSDTTTAIQKFERERKLPVTGQVSDRLVRELAIVIGHPIE